MEALLVNVGKLLVTPSPKITASFQGKFLLTVDAASGGPSYRTGTYSREKLDSPHVQNEYWAH